MAGIDIPYFKKAQGDIWQLSNSSELRGPQKMMMMYGIKSHNLKLSIRSLGNWLSKYKDLIIDWLYHGCSILLKYAGFISN